LLHSVDKIFIFSLLTKFTELLKLKSGYKPATMIKRLLLFMLVLPVFLQAYAREGMWIPVLLEKYNIREMKSMGFQLTAEDIYSINQASMKDAVMIFGGGCTAELISDNGLIITNYHCGYSAIQSHSSIQNDYLTNGFWAMAAAEELPNPRLKVTFLKRMEDVTGQVTEGVSDTLSMAQREVVIKKNMERIEMEAVAGTHYSAEVEAFYYGNQYFLFVNEVFTDVRLVGAPPSAIGKFGGDTDNWMWPRHTGDFSLFRIYADAENQPAEYSPANVPFKPVAHFPISLAGVQENDFTMVFGYPGSTSQYVTSYHIDLLANHVYPNLVALRSAKLEVMKRHMEADPRVRIQYASKEASISNSWKKWKGEIQGLKKLDAVAEKREYEHAFLNWVNASDHRQQNLGGLLQDYQETYAQYLNYRLVRDLLMEFIGRSGLESARLAGSFERLALLNDKKEADAALIEKERAQLRADVTVFFKDYHWPVDVGITEVTLDKFRNMVPPEFLPDNFKRIDADFQGDIGSYTRDLFNRTLFSHPLSAYKFLNDTSSGCYNRLKQDPAYQLFNAFRNTYYDLVSPQLLVLQQRIDSLNHVYMAAMMMFQPDRVFYPDANSTLRVSYGQVKGYEARDGVFYKHYSTLEGILQKDNPAVYDYRVPAKLKDLYKNKDFGPYGVAGSVPVCFTADNHTTGGNSGSPVVNGRGELIGINFDRAWEGVMSDLIYNPEQSRNISLDIRYVLFIIDKFAGAGYLLDEMTIVN
jgi:hypothetical protein